MVHYGIDADKKMQEILSQLSEYFTLEGEDLELYNLAFDVKGCLTDFCANHTLSPEELYVIETIAGEKFTITAGMEKRPPKISPTP